MIGNQIQAIARLPSLSMDQLLHVIQANDGSVPAYAALAELNARKKRAAGFAGTEAPQTSVKDDVVQQAGGLQSLRPPQAPMPGMAEGGLVGDEEDTYLKRMRAQGLNPGWAAIRDYFASSDRKPLWDVAVDKVGGFFNNPSPQAAAPGVDAYGPKSGWGADKMPAAPAAPPAAPAAKTPAQSPGGIASVSASTTRRGGAAAPPAAGFKVPELKIRSMQEALEDIPKDTSVQEAIAAMKAGDTSGKDLQNAKWEALMRTGLTMAGTPGNFARSLSVGATQGLDSLSANRRMIQQDQQARDKEMRNLSIAQGRQGLERYGIAQNARFQEAGIADKGIDNQMKAWQVGVESGDRRAQMANALEVARIHASASRMAQTDLGKMKLVGDIVAKASDDFDAQAKDPAGMMARMGMPPEQLRQARDAFIADRLKMLPGLSNYYAAPAAQKAPGLTAAPTGKVLSLN